MWLIYLFLGIGMTFQALGVLSLHRFPDVYTRQHGATLCTTFGSFFLYLGIVLYVVLFSNLGWTDSISFSVHVFLVLCLVLITGPTGAHAIARATYRSGILPWGAVVDKLQGE
ncbi:MAG: cation:proton antiporter [Candidatus Makaraimicrobium thalassicum]|nr:MAG: cation:proton antiporter [Candidatus Omnitrophota bacterium]